MPDSEQEHERNAQFAGQMRLLWARGTSNNESFAGAIDKISGNSIGPYENLQAAGYHRFRGAAGGEGSAHFEGDEVAVVSAARLIVHCNLAVPPIAGEIVGPDE